MASSLLSHICILLSAPSVEFYRSDLGTTTISKIYFSKSEQVQVHVHSISNLSLHCTKRWIIFWPQCWWFTSFYFQKQWYQWGQKQGLYFVIGFEFGHSLGIPSELHKDWTHLYSWQQSIPALLARGVPQCPETGKGLLLELLVILSGARETAVYETGPYLCGVVHHNTPTPSSV